MSLRRSAGNAQGDDLGAVERAVDAADVQVHFIVARLQDGAEGIIRRCRAIEGDAGAVFLDDLFVLEHAHVQVMEVLRQDQRRRLPFFLVFLFLYLAVDLFQFFQFRGDPLVVLFLQALLHAGGVRVQVGAEGHVHVDRFLQGPEIGRPGSGC